MFLEQPIGGLDNIVYIKIKDGTGGYLKLPVLTTTERDALTATNGMFVFNSTTNQVECYTNGGWSGWTGGINWRGSWATATTYSGNDAVENGGESYICTAAHTSDSTTEPGVGASWASHWDKMAEKGATGQLVGSGSWAISTSYTADVDVVENDGSGYVCSTTHTSTADDEPGVGVNWATYWDLLVSKGDTGATGPTGAAGADGADGADGLPGGDSFVYAFDITTTKADPTSGKLRYNNATPSSVTEIYIDYEDTNAVDVSTWLAALDDSTSTIKGRLRVFKKDDSSKFATFNITAITDETGYYTLAVTYVVGNSTFADTDSVVITFAFTGDRGETGAGAQTPWSSDIDAAGYGISDLKTLDFSDATTVTIATGAVTLTQGNHTIDTEAAAATDDLDTINGLGNGEIAFLRAADGSRTVVLKHGTGNILIPGDSDYSLDDATKTVQVLGDGTNVHLVGAAGGSGTDANAIHDNVAGEISAITEKTSPTSSDLILIENAAASYVKNKVQIGNLPNIIKVTNSCGVTVAAGDVGYIDNNGEYQRTTTAADNVPWCVVETGGATGSAIYVMLRGRITVNYTGTDPAAGDYLVTSATGGSAQQQTTLCPEIFAVCLSAGSSGSVDALLLTQRTLYPRVSTSDVLRVDNLCSTSDFQATISGTPSTTSVVYAGATGDVKSCDPNSSTELGKFVLHNTTRGTSRLITAIDTATSTITTEASTDAWANTDAISARSLTNTDTKNSGYFYDISLSNLSSGSLFKRAVGIQLWIYHLDNGSPNNDLAILGLHPYIAYADGKFLGVYTGSSSVWTTLPLMIPLYDKKFTVRLIATGANTANYIMRLQGIWEATP